MVLTYEIYVANHLQLELEAFGITGESAKKFLEKRYFGFLANNTNLTVDFIENEIEESVNLEETTETA